ncbi:MAG: signal peptidase I [Clostridia bacterium]|nr:signal peptidase I [Clostridia bacterium]
MLAKFKKVVNIISLSFLGLALLLAILLVGVRIFGVTPYTVLSGSMEPNYPVGSIVYVQKVNPADLKERDVITYTIGKTVVTHRIIEVIEDENNPTNLSFRTKGDNNDDADGDPVLARNIIGKVVFSLPLLGYMAFVIQTPPFSYMVILVCVMILLLAFMPDVLEKLLAEEQAKTEQTDETQKKE